jgi:hypothetical protein
MDQAQKRIIAEILDREVAMFLRVPARQEPSCRAHLDDMQLHRRGQFSVWSPSCCESYLRDLRRAEEEGRNLMTIKYARMEDLIPPVSQSKWIPEIVSRFVGWQREMLSHYPNIMRGGRDIDDFANYLRCELETYSDATLELLWKDVDAFSREKQNMSKAIYEFLARQSGYTNIDEMEKRLKKS